MIKNTKQQWTLGKIVNVGFMKDLMVMEIVPTPGDWMPDEYILMAGNGNKYSFVPHNGLTRI